MGLHIVEDKSNYGIYVWLLPDGSVFKDDDNNVLNIPSMRGDIEKMSEIRKAASYWGQPEGQPVFIAGIGRVTEEEYQEDQHRMSEGLLPYGDVGAWRDAGRASRSLDR